MLADGASITGMSNEPTTSEAGEDRYLSPAQVSEMVPGLSVRTLREWRAADRGGLPWSRISEKRVAYLESDVRAWALARRHVPGG